jgi:hypothetical protein
MFLIHELVDMGENRLVFGVCFDVHRITLPVDHCFGPMIANSYCRSPVRLFTTASFTAPPMDTFRSGYKEYSPHRCPGQTDCFSGPLTFHDIKVGTPWLRIFLLFYDRCHFNKIVIAII